MASLVVGTGVARAGYSQPMTPAEWSLSAADGELRVHTGVEGRAAKMGHRLTIAMNRWHAAVHWVDTEPASAELTVDVHPWRFWAAKEG